jgi:lysine-specific demethylase/histidyl-hydroxylase NO66
MRDLISGIAVEEFYEKFWGRAPIKFPQPLANFRDLYSVREFERRVSQSDIRYPALALARGGEKISRNLYTYSRTIGGDVADDFVDVPTVYRLWDEGATIILNSLQNSAPSMFQWLRQAEAELRHPVQVNAYLTPPNSQGFGVHYDTHDVFVVQLEGRKHWRIWTDAAAPSPLPHEKSKRNPDLTGNPLFLDEVIEEGDIIYLPRGYYHEARSVDAISLHVTLGVPVFRRIDALKAIFDEVVTRLEKSKGATWRTALDGTYLQPDSKELSMLRDEVTSHIAECWSTFPIARKFHERPRPIPHVSLDSRHALALESDTDLELAAHIVPYVESDDSTVSIVFSGQRLEMPILAKAAIDRILASKRISPVELCEYETDTAVSLCRHLVAGGVLRPSSQAE